MKRLLTISAAAVLCATCIHWLSGALFAQRPAQPAQPGQQQRSNAQPAQRPGAQPKAATKPTPPRVAPRTPQDRAVGRLPHYGAAIGGQGGKPTFGIRTVDIRDFGAIPNTDCTLAIQRAYDSLYTGGLSQASANRNQGILHIPSGTWLLSSPLWFDASYISIQCEPGAVLSMYGTNCASYPILAGVQRTTTYGGAWTGYSPTFDIGHRFDMWNGGTPKLDSSVITGASQKWALCSRGASSPAAASVADHYVSFFAGPPATGVNDYWRNTQKFTVELAFDNAQGPIGGGPICGIGASDLKGYMGCWNLRSDGTTFRFQISTLEGVGAETWTRTFNFGNATGSGVQKLCVQLDFTANTTVGGESVCSITAAQNGNQVTVTRGIGTRYQFGRHTIQWAATGGTFTYTGINGVANTTTTVVVAANANTSALQTAMDTVYGAGNTVVFADSNYSGWPSIKFIGALANATIPDPVLDGTNLTGVTHPAIVLASEPGFNSSNNLHFDPNYYRDFSFFADPANGNTQTPMNSYRLYGFKLSKGWIYTDQGAGNPEHRADGTSNTDYKRYFSNGYVASDICWLPLDEPPDDPTKVTNKLVKISLATSGSPVPGYGWFVKEGTVPDASSNVGGQNYYNLSTLCSNFGAGGGIYCFNLLPAATFSNCTFTGGWQGMTLIGGYDYMIQNTYAKGADATVFANLVNATITGSYRYDVGEVVWRLRDSNWNAEGANVKTGNINTQNHTSESIFRVHNGGGYGYVYKFGSMETDNEISPGVPLLHADLITAGVPATFHFKNILSANLGGNPNILLTGSSNNSGLQATNTVWIDHITQSDGFEVSTDGPAWQVFIRESNGSLDGEPVRFAGVGPNPQGRVEYVKTVAAVPSAGRFQAGSIRLMIWNPAAGGVAEYRCTGSGTAAYNSGYTYYGGAYCQSGGTEYQAITATTGNAPPNATYWRATGRTGVSAPVWKAVSTVSN